jgi:hypothetical protein
VCAGPTQGQGQHLPLDGHRVLHALLLRARRGRAVIGSQPVKGHAPPIRENLLATLMS